MQGPREDETVFAESNQASLEFGARLIFESSEGLPGSVFGIVKSPESGLRSNAIQFGCELPFPA